MDYDVIVARGTPRALNPESKLISLYPHWSALFNRIQVLFASGKRTKNSSLLANMCGDVLCRQLRNHLLMLMTRFNTSIKLRLWRTFSFDNKLGPDWRLAYARLVSHHERCGWKGVCQVKASFLAMRTYSCVALCLGILGYKIKTLFKM